MKIVAHCFSHLDTGWWKSTEESWSPFTLPSIHQVFWLLAFPKIVPPGWLSSWWVYTCDEIAFSFNLFQQIFRNSWGSLCWPCNWKPRGVVLQRTMGRNACSCTWLYPLSTSFNWSWFLSCCLVKFCYELYNKFVPIMIYY